MGQGIGAKTITNGLIFSYDANSEKSYTGPPIQNMANVITASGSFTGASIGYTAGTETVSIPTLGTMTVPYMEGYNSNSASYCCLQQFYFVTGNGSVPCSGSTQYTYGIVYRTTSGYTHPNYMYRYEYNSSDGYVTEAGVHDDTKRVHLGNGWYWAWNTFTTQSTTAKLYLRSFYYQYNVLDRHSVAKVLVTPGDYTGLPPRLWPALGTTKSSAATILDPVGKNTLTATGLTYASNGDISLSGSNSYIDISNTSIVSGTNPFTFESWTNKTSGTYGEILGNYGSGYTSGVWWSTAGIFLNGGSVYHTDYANTMAGIHHSAVTRDSLGNIILYRDGVQVNSGTLSASIPTNINWRMGADVNGAGEALIGNLYNVKVYNRALTPQEIQQNFNALRGRYGI